MARFTTATYCQNKAMNGQDVMAIGEGKEPSAPKSDTSQYLEVHLDTPSPGVSVERSEYVRQDNCRQQQKQQNGPTPQTSHFIPHVTTKETKKDCSSQLESDGSDHPVGMSGKFIE